MKLCVLRNVSALSENKARWRLAGAPLIISSTPGGELALDLLLFIHSFMLFFIFHLTTTMSLDATSQSRVKKEVMFDLGLFGFFGKTMKILP